MWITHSFTRPRKSCKKNRSSNWVGAYNQVLPQMDLMETSRNWWIFSTQSLLYTVLHFKKELLSLFSAPEIWIGAIRMLLLLPFMVYSISFFVLPEDCVPPASPVGLKSPRGALPRVHRPPDYQMNQHLSPVNENASQHHIPESHLRWQHKHSPEHYLTHFWSASVTLWPSQLSSHQSHTTRTC